MSRDVLMRAALALAERGMAVFPLRPGTKRPAVRRDWEGCATTSVEQIERWWYRSPYNIGVATGPSKLVVVDLDAPSRRASAERHGRQVLADLAAEVGVEIPRETFTVVTPGGGQHLYFRAPEERAFTNTAGRLGLHIDTRAVGGYVVGPGSRIADRTYRATVVAAPAPLPSWLSERLRPCMPLPVDTDARQHPAYVEAAVRNEVSRVTEAPTGRRNFLLFRAAASLARFVPDGMITENDIRRSLVAASARHIGVDGFTAQEVTRTIESGLRRGRGGGMNRGTALPQMARSARGTSP